MLCTLCVLPAAPAVPAAAPLASSTQHNSTPALPCPALSPSPQAAKAAALLERAAMLRREAEQQQDSSWVAFESLLAILQAAGALEGTEEESGQPALVGAAAAPAEAAAAATGEGGEGGSGEGSSSAVAAAGDEGEAGGTRVGFMPLGHVAREVNCSNELWMALVLTHSALQSLEPPQLASVLSAGAACGCCSCCLCALLLQPARKAPGLMHPASVGSLSSALSSALQS